MTENGSGGESEYLVDVDEAFLRALVQRGSDVVLTIDADGRVVFTNDTIEDVLGYAPEDVVGEPLTTVMPERFQDSHFAAMDEYLETGERSLDWDDVQLPALHADGHEVPLDITFHEHPHDDERLFSGIMKDVTAQVQYEDRLRALQETTERLMNESDRDAIARIVVDAAEDVLGFPLATVFVTADAAHVDVTADAEVAADADVDVAVAADVDDPDVGLVPLAASDRSEALFDGVPALDAGGSVAWDVYEAGEMRAFEDVREATAVYDPETPARSEVVLPLSTHGVLVLGRTEPGAPDDDELDLAKVLASATEAAFDRADRERELRERERRLRRQNERLDEFASVLSHDLRDPLNAASMQVELARDDLGDSEYLDQLENVHDRMAALVDDVLALTREGDAVGDTERVDLASIAIDAWQTAGVPGATLDVADDLGTVDADPERLRTVLENLLGNSVKHGAGADGNVTVTVGALPDCRGFYVADDGPGIPPGEREHVFEHGYTNDADGTGLGLNIVRTVARAHGWTVAVAESESGGARFEVDVSEEASR